MKEKTPKERFTTLSNREREVLELVCQHKGYPEIAEIFVISESTVKTHMDNTFIKLGLKHLKHDKRVITLHTTYCPIFSELDETANDIEEKEIIDSAPEQAQKSEPEMESAPKPLEEEITDGDEEEIITIAPKPKNGGRKKMGNRKGRRAFRLVLLLIVAALIVFGGWQGLKWFSNIPMGSSGSAYEVGEWVKKDDVWVRLSDYEVTGTVIALDVEVWNKTGKEYFFSWDAENNFSMVDNLNDKYEVAGGYLRKVNLDTNERMKIPGHSIGTIDFKNDPLYKSGVTDLYVTMEYFSTIDEAIFHIGVGN